MLATNVTKKGQVTIPKEIRDALGIKEHDKMAFALKENEIIMKPLSGNLLDLRGAVKPKKRPENFEKIRKQVRQKITEKIVGDSDV